MPRSVLPFCVLVSLAACESPDAAPPPPLPGERGTLIVGGEAPRVQELDEEGRSVVIGGQAPNAIVVRPTPLPAAVPAPAGPAQEAEVEVVDERIPEREVVVAPVWVDPRTLTQAPTRSQTPTRPQTP